MKILHVVPSMMANGGGTSEYVPMAAIAQLHAGADVAIAFRDCGNVSGKAHEAEMSGVRLLGCRFDVRWWNPLRFNLGFCRLLWRVAAESDVIITHCSWIFPVWWAAHVARKLGKPYCMMPHGSFAPERLRLSAWKKRLVGWIDRHYARHAAAVWTTSESEAEDVRAYVPGVRTEVFPIGLDMGRPQAVRNGGDGRRTLLFFSRISPIKGLDLLAEAWGELEREERRGAGGKRWKLLIVGPDDRGYREKIEKVFAEKCPAGSYEFRGPVYGEDKLRLLLDADAFVLPTRNENWGIAVAEAMACGLPVVCTKGAPWKCLETERAGRWVDVSAEGIRQGLEDVLALDDGERRAMGERGRKWVGENLDWRRIAARMLDRCADVLQERGKCRKMD